MMKATADQYYSYPRMYFADSVGRPFAEKHWDDFIQAMDKYALQYMNTLEKVLEEKYK